MEKVVSILTPCYNGEKFIWRLLDSILSQTYPRVEMFVIDDGSTDNSAELIRSYIPRFEAKGYTLTYVYQENQGLAATINNGLKLVTGDYLVWPDIDDWYATNDAIEQMAVCLANSDDTVSMVRCQSYILDEDTLVQIGKFCVTRKNRGKTMLFDDCMFMKNGYWIVPGEYMAKIAKIDEAIPRREIYVTKYGGQDWQLMLPLMYKDHCLTIEKFLYNILARSNSHSRMQQTLERKFQMSDCHENTLLATVDNIAEMPVEEKDRYKRSVRTRYLAIRIYHFILYRDFKGAVAFFAQLDGVSKITVIWRIVKTVVRKSLEKLGK